MNRKTLILLQAIGVLSILPYPFVLLASIMSIAAPGRNSTNSLPWILLLAYPLVWVVLYVLAWRAMGRGAVGLAFGLSSIPAGACLLMLGFYIFSWVGFGLGTVGVGSGGLHTTTYPTNNPVLDSLWLAGEDIKIGHEPERAVARALREMERNPTLMNVGVAPYGTPLNIALTIIDDQWQDRIRMVRAIINAGGRLRKNATPRPSLCCTLFLNASLRLEMRTRRFVSALTI